MAGTAGAGGGERCAVRAVVRGGGVCRNPEADGRTDPHTAGKAGVYAVEGEKAEGHRHLSCDGACDDRAVACEDGDTVRLPALPVSFAGPV